MNIAKIIENKTELQSIRQINPCKKIVFTSGCFDILHYRPYWIYCSIRNRICKIHWDRTRIAG